MACPGSVGVRLLGLSAQVIKIFRVLADEVLMHTHACHRAFRLDILRVRGPDPSGVHLAGLELFAAC